MDDVTLSEQNKFSVTATIMRETGKFCQMTKNFDWRDTKTTLPPCQATLSFAVTNGCTFMYCNQFVGVASLPWQSEKQRCRQHKKHIVKVTVTHSMTIA